MLHRVARAAQAGPGLAVVGRRAAGSSARTAGEGVVEQLRSRRRVHEQARTAVAAEGEPEGQAIASVAAAERRAAGEAPRVADPDAVATASTARSARSSPAAREPALVEGGGAEVAAHAVAPITARATGAATAVATSRSARDERVVERDLRARLQHDAEAAMAELRLARRSSAAVEVAGLEPHVPLGARHDQRRIGQPSRGPRGDLQAREQDAAVRREADDLHGAVDEDVLRLHGDDL